MEQKVDIIMVEDSASDAELAIRALRKSNIVKGILHLKNGEEALEYIFAEGKYTERDLRETPKIILLDLKMPKVSGLEVLRTLKSDERTKAIPIIILTSSSEDKDIREGYKLGANSYIVKPVGFESFLKAVSDIGLYWLLLNQHPKQAES